MFFFVRNAGTGDNDTVICSGNTRGDDGDEFVFLGAQQSYYTKQNFINNPSDLAFFGKICQKNKFYPIENSPTAKKT